MSQFIHIFPLSVYRDRIDLQPDYKAELVQLILEMAGKPDSASQGTSAWLGDTSGQEFLFQHDRFQELYRQIAIRVKNYTESLGINNDLLEFFYQRSWATITRRGEYINEHCHEQSNISFAYYLLKPPNSGAINFITYNHPNEFSPGVFTPAKEHLGFIKNSSMLTWNKVTLDPKEDEILIFPSKTLHATSPSESDAPRISISADITTMLRDSHGHETMMPHFSHWRPLDDGSHSG